MYIFKITKKPIHFNVLFCFYFLVNTKDHEWMIDPILLELTASEPLTLEEEFENQKSWHQVYLCCFI